uniref:Uncharacterized protein n=1 Tax=Vespula pensylvanica TaxID=30213 RepID=A0A834NER6_VESPE|nr:hypothetical protein H0235_014248 [Vespula pensylvanica]
MDVNRVLFIITAMGIACISVHPRTLSCVEAVGYSGSHFPQLVTWFAAFPSGFPCCRHGYPAGKYTLAIVSMSEYLIYRNCVLYITFKVEQNTLSSKDSAWCEYMYEYVSVDVYIHTYRS